MVTRDRTWSPVVLYGYHGYQWLSVVSYGYQSLYMVTSGFYGYHGYQYASVFMVIIVISGYQWFPVVTIACVWSPVVFMVISRYMHGYCDYQWLCMVISGCMHGNSSAIFKPVRADTKASKDVCPSVVCKMKRPNKRTWWVQCSEEKG